MSFVYVIGRMYGDFKSMGAPTKIGVSDNPWSRLRTIQTSCPFGIYIYHYYRFRSKEEAFDTERIVHKVLNKDRIQGEWFNVDPEEVYNLLQENL